MSSLSVSIFLFLCLSLYISMSLSSCAFVLVCEQEENRILAESILSFIVHYSHDHIMNMEQKSAEVSTYLSLP